MNYELRPSSICNLGWYGRDEIWFGENFLSQQNHDNGRNSCRISANEPGPNLRTFPRLIRQQLGRSLIKIINYSKKRFSDEYSWQI